MAIRLAKFDGKSIPVSLGRLRLGQILTAKKRYPEADELLRLAAENLTAARGASDTFTRNAIKARVDLYQAWGKKAEARAQETLLAASGTTSAPK